VSLRRVSTPWGWTDLGDTKRFILNCPFISARVRADALQFLGGRARKDLKTAENITSTLHRLTSTGPRRQFIVLEVTQMLFFGTLGGDNSYARPLLRTTLGYDVGNERELSQVARKMGVGGGRDVLHSAALWCFCLGPGMFNQLHGLAVFAGTRADKVFQGF
jgi:hypothetical protein